MRPKADHAGRPDPDEVASAVGFVDAMRRLKAWSGLAYRQLERRAALAGDTLPRSTLTAALTRQVLPREDVVAAFVRACGGHDEETRRWIAARRRVAAMSSATTSGSRDEIALLGIVTETPRAYVSIAVSCAHAGRTTEAIFLLEKVTAGSAWLLGDEHPDTLRAYVSIAVSCAQAGRTTEPLAPERGA